MRWQRNMFQKRNKIKLKKNKPSEVEIGNLPEKIIQSSSAEDDPRSQKKNGGAD